MAFNTQNSYQMNMDDSFINLSSRTQRIIEHSWAKPFADNVFPAIDASSFSVLYSDNNASRPTTPVNCIIGALILKEMQGLSDDELLESICCDVRFQYALHTTSYKEQPFSDRTLSRFRERLYNYEKESGIDLLKNEMVRLSLILAENLNIDGSIKRMDSLMIAAHAKSMTRLEIIYTTVQYCLRVLVRNDCKALIPEELRHYLDSDDENKVIYYAKDVDVEERIDKALSEAKLVREIMSDGSWNDYEEYQLLLRMLNDQTNEDGSPKDKKKISPTSLQNPNDPDATYRSKAGKGHKGYVGNIEESIGEDGSSIVTNFSYEENVHSDQEFCNDYLENNSDETMITDGAYTSVELQEKAKDKNIELVATSLTGKETDPVFADFQLNEERTEVIQCPAGNTPVECTYNEKTESIRVKMNKPDCQHCPFREQCKPKFQKKNAVINVTFKMVQRAQYIKLLGTDEMKKLTRKRNAVEGIMSVLRRKYHVDAIPVFGKMRSKVFFYFKVVAFNVNKFIKHYPQSQEIAQLAA